MSFSINTIPDCQHLFDLQTTDGCNMLNGNLQLVTKRNKRKCLHNRRKTRCKECGGSEICPHDRQRAQCIECGGSGICLHNKRRTRCKECGGSEICPHKRRRTQCKECGGSEICPHDTRRIQCKECSPIHCGCGKTYSTVHWKRHEKICRLQNEKVGLGGNM